MSSRRVDIKHLERSMLSLKVLLIRLFQYFCNILNELTFSYHVLIANSVIMQPFMTRLMFPCGVNATKHAQFCIKKEV